MNERLQKRIDKFQESFYSEDWESMDPGDMLMQANSIIDDLSTLLANQDIMTPNEYVSLAMRTGQMNELSYGQLLTNAALGLAGESGEFVDHIKKYLFHGHKLDEDYIAKELGDIMWYIALAASTLDLSLESIMEGNIEKLKKRYPGEGFDPERSINRKE